MRLCLNRPNQIGRLPLCTDGKVVGILMMLDNDSDDDDIFGPVSDPIDDDDSLDGITRWMDESKC